MRRDTASLERTLSAGARSQHSCCSCIPHLLCVLELLLQAQVLSVFPHGFSAAYAAVWRAQCRAEPESGPVLPVQAGCKRRHAHRLRLCSGAESSSALQVSADGRNDDSQRKHHPPRLWHSARLAPPARCFLSSVASSIMSGLLRATASAAA